MTITAKYSSTCAACGGAILPGQKIEWQQGQKPRHTTCAGQQSNPAVKAGTEQSKAPGENATVAGRATYRGKTYYVAGRVVRGRTHYDDSVEMVMTRDGARVLLYFRDGSGQFWADYSQVTIDTRYERPQTIRRLAKFAEDRKAGRGRYECEECGEWVEAGTRCWETGALH